MMKIQDGATLAAIDIGSNSIRLEMSILEHGQPVFYSYHKETARLGGGLLSNGHLSATAMQTGYACLRRFAEHLRGLPSHQVMAVATQTLREANNRQEFIREGSAILGFPIRVISGREEARLIYQGVSYLLPQDDERRLVVDIGGRSTEVIVGVGYAAERSESIVVGSVNASLDFFTDGKITTKQCKRAVAYATALLENALMVTQDFEWEQAYGASGTIGAVADILRVNKMSDGSITREHLNALLDIALRAGSADKIRLEGLRDDRRPVIAGGLCVMLALFELLGVDRLMPAKGALRHGLLLDILAVQGVSTNPMVNRSMNMRAQTVSRLQKRFQVDVVQAKRVRDCAVGWAESLHIPTSILSYAADIHEMGTIVSHVDYHKLGAYMLDRCDVLGFSSLELKKITALILGQRGGLKKLDEHWLDLALMEKLLLLRLAVILCHARQTPPVNALQIRATAIPAMEKSGQSQKKFELDINRQLFEKMPQTLYLLKVEVALWNQTAIPFTVHMQDDTDKFL